MEKEKLKPLMFAGTGSDVGKSIIVTGICRILKQDGYAPSPFKAQNMALNSFPTYDGFEIGRAQAVQAEAAGLLPICDMNPLLLKPNTDLTSQVILNGKPAGNKSAYEYFRKDGREVLRKEVHSAFDRLASSYNPIILEGAGSISEMNLQEVDLVNMPMARYADANIILVADIDRGGVFASIYGSVMLQKPEDRKRIKGVIINKFRGDIRLFDSGIKIIEETSGIPVIGVIPYYKDIHIEEEDSVVLKNKHTKWRKDKVNVVVILLSHLSNFTDFNMLEKDERINLYYSSDPIEIEKADIIIIPGTKNTISDLKKLYDNGIAKAIIKAATNNKTIFGICGGYQMMGKEINDPFHMEGDLENMDGLGLLPIRTTITKDKSTCQKEFHFLNFEDKCRGYEIHMGVSELDNLDNVNPLIHYSNGESDGCFVGKKCMGSYMHGILDNKCVIDYLLKPYTSKVNNNFVDYLTFKEEQYNKLANHIRNNIDVDLFYKILNER